MFQRGVGQSCYIFPFEIPGYISPFKSFIISGIPGCIILGLFGTWKVDLLTIETANNFKTFYLFIL